MKKTYLQILYSLIGITGALFVALYLLYQNLTYKIDRAIDQGWFAPSLEYYSSEKILETNQSYSLKELKRELTLRNYIPQVQRQKLKPNEYILLTKKECQPFTSQSFSDCLLWINKDFPYLKNLVVFHATNMKLYQGSPLSLVPSLPLDPVLFAQHEGQSLHLRKRFQISEVPYLCLQSITLAEDQNFLLHKGASPTGIFRALIRNIKNVGIKEGGSTITQQLIKNRFLSSEKTFKRKWIELMMSVILERKLTKDQILELYLNTIYMGGTGSYSLYGFASASQYYFNKPLHRLQAHECALLSALVPSPGRLNPFAHPKRAQNRRDIILQKLNTNNIISEIDFQKAIKSPLPDSTQKFQNEKAPYFVQAVYKTLQKLNIDLNQSLKIYTTIDLETQQKARRALQDTLKTLDKKQKNLEGALIFVDLKTNKIRALVGGRNFMQSQFNRAVESKRSIGSLVKPWTYLSALTTQNLTPLSLLHDYPFDKQGWSPKNYKNRYYGKVPLYFALKESLNTASAQMALQVGLKNIIDTFQKLGMTSTVEEFPSLTLGAVELSLLEVIQMYSTIARMGSYLKLSFIEKVQRPTGEILYQNSKQAQQMFSRDNIAVLLGMMKQVVESGTAKWIQPFWFHPTAGKTGTSNDERDSWFVGFTPNDLTGVWLGYDDNTPHQLTGSAGALPVWLNFMKVLNLNPYDFNWPENIEKKKIATPKVVPSSCKDMMSFKEKDKNMKCFTLETPLDHMDQQPNKDLKMELIFKKPTKKWYQRIFN